MITSRLKSKYISILPALAALFLSFVSCEEKSLTIGQDVIGDDPFTTGSASYDVYAYNHKIDAVQTNRMPVYQVGTFIDPAYGRTEASINTQLQLSTTNPVFGDVAQENESTPENERVTEVILYMPY